MIHYEYRLIWEGKGLEYVTFPNFDTFPELVCGMFTRHGGVSKPPYHESNFRLDCADDPMSVWENYRRAGETLGFPESRLIAARQVHGNEVRVVEECDAGIFWNARPECDGFVTNVKHLPLGVFAADCQPVLLYDPVAGAIGAVHAGWRGTAGMIAVTAVRTMQKEYGSAPENIRVAIGPHIHECCYEVSADVAEKLGQSGDFVSLSACVKRDLLHVGVREENLYVSSVCTRCEHTRFWSHRAVAGGERGVCLAVIMLKEERK